MIKLSEETPGYSRQIGYMYENGFPVAAVGYPYDEIISRLPMAGTLLEVGSGCGLSAVTFAEKFAETNRDYTIHTVDIFKGIFCYPPNSGKMRGYTGDQQKKYLDRILDTWDNISYTECDFFKKEWDIPTVFFYDGDHSFDATLQALLTMRDTPVIVVDDYTKEWKEVIKAVNLFAKETGRDMEIIESASYGVAVFG